jgi:ABC-type transport system involved in multi-copper enzyme maturation permease subunit
MTVRMRFAILAHLIQDTFRQASASGIGWMMLAVTAVCVMLCLSVSVSGDVPLHDDAEPVFFLPQASSPDSKKIRPEDAMHEGVETLAGRMTLAFGAVSFPVSRERGDAVHFLELVLAGGVAGTFGLLLALVWTAGFVPTFLEPGASSVLLAKPVPRWQLLVGKYVGVLAFVAIQVSLFVALTWLALGVRTSVWTLTYWWSVPLLLVQFAIFYSFSILLAVVTRSTVACVFGAALFWCLAWAINYGVILTRGVPEPQYLLPSTIGLTELAYWIFPKPIDAGLILFNALDAANHFQKPEVFRLLETGHVFSAKLSILSSLLFTGVALAISAHQLEATDY